MIFQSCVLFCDCFHVCIERTAKDSCAFAPRLPAFREKTRNAANFEISTGGTSEASPRRRFSHHRARPRVDLRSHQTETAHTHGCRPEPAPLV